MSIKVDLAALDAALADFGYAYLLTTGADFRPHAVAVTAEWNGTDLTVGEPGRRTTANIGVHPVVSLVHPPAEPGGYSLIVDGEAVLDGDALRVRPTSAVLHRPATPETPPQNPGCSADCRPLTGKRRRPGCAAVRRPAA
ncbi:pyridoxamine 5'-phosphate oxidase family protein [Rhodococcus sp. HM1]|uniref:pyridoxamine 5'-phosphate oxidase family protein n=1 Tax=Rhodococcus sp. HM1 TaxID=2937759 RepID=UPI00200AB910|nr:pyridoxamine 5'-phosphate oxidase family protein [Rhodococcus sp. HM1]MCK8670027.1 pyridoxamine 5'-phosphate oxidase family protein [Rhodococcus sp. HM1]